MKDNLLNFFINLKSAFQFLTIIPLGRAHHFDPHLVKPFFPLVGLVIGLLLAFFDQLVGNLWPQPVTALLDVVFLVIITGAFHVDGLGDMADGLYGGQTRHDALKIMKDSRIGTMGLVTIVCSLSLKWAGIYTLTTNRFLLLTIVPALARGSMLFGMHFLEYGRSKSGTGHAFFSQKLDYKGFSWILLPVLIAFTAGLQGVALLFMYVGFTAGILFYYKRKLGCITGDMLGGMTESLEAILFLCVSIV